MVKSFLILFSFLFVSPLWGAPPYCQNLQEGSDEFIGTACQEYLLYRHGQEEVDKLSGFSEKLSAHVYGVSENQIEKDLYKMTATRMLSKKLHFVSLYPDLGVGSQKPFYTVKKNRGHFNTSDIDRGRTDDLKQCLRKDPELVSSVKESESVYQAHLHKNSPADFEKMQQSYVAQLVVSAIKTKKDWDSVPAIRESKQTLEKEFRQASMNKSILARAIKRAHGQRRKDLQSRLAQAEATQKSVGVKLKRATDKLESVQQSVLADPLWSEATGILEFDSNDHLEDFRPSAFFTQVMDSMNSVRGEKNSGKQFVNFLESLINKGDLGQAILRISHLLQVDPNLFHKLNGAVKENLKGQLNDIDTGLEQLCESEGAGLSQYQLLVDDLATKHMHQAFDSKDDAKKKLELFRKSHCSLLQKDQGSHGLAGTLVFGGILLAGAALAPFTGGGSLAVGLMFAGGLGLTTMGGMETYQSYKKLDLEKGMMTANLVTAQEVRSTLSDVRVNTGMSVLDVALMPLDVVQLVKVASKARRVEQGLQDVTHIASKQDNLVESSGHLKQGEHVADAGVVAPSRLEIKTSPEALAFKSRYESKHLELRNDLFIDTIDTPAPLGKKHLFFDVENSVLKKLNDVVFEDKALGDAAGNMFSSRVYELIQKNPVLKKKLVADYKDYKSIRFKFLLNEGEDSAKYEKMLEKIYKQANADFIKEIEQAKLSGLWDGMTGQLAHPSQWFLAGTGPDAIKANMATRGGREVLPRTGEGVISSFEGHRGNIQKHLDSIIDIRDSMAKNTKMMDSGLVVKGKNGDYIMDDTAIEIVRKAESGKGDAARRADIKKNVKKLYGVELSDSEVNKMVNYFDEIDTMSPPLFLRKREIIPYENAENGIVSVDFAGIGVNNTREAMEGVNLAALSSKGGDWVDNGLVQINEHVEHVTKQMTSSKEYYRDVINKVYKDKESIYFSGDDGIYLPKQDLSAKQKEHVVKMISSNDPKQFRMTFVKTKFTDGSSVPKHLRSEYVVQSEKLEKSIRKEIVGVGDDLIDRESAKKLMIAVDYVPQNEANGVYNIIVSGDVSTEQLKKIKRVFKAQSGEGKQMGKVTFLPSKK